MRVLLDNNLNHRLRPLLVPHEVVHCRYLGWAELRNGTLLAAAEESGFDVLVTGDKNLQYQQSLAGRRISVMTLGGRDITIEGIAPLVPELLAVLENLPEGSFVTVGGEDGQ